MFKSVLGWLKNIFGLISRVMKLEDRVSTLEKKIDSLQAPQKDIKEGLEYNQEWNYYFDKTTGEKFCNVCIGNGKRVAVRWQKDFSGEGWHCQNCKAFEWKTSHRKEFASGSDYNPLGS